MIIGWVYAWTVMNWWLKFQMGIWTQTPPTSPLHPKTKMFIYWMVHSLQMICQKTPNDSSELLHLKIGQANQWTSPSATPTPARKMKSHFWIMFNFWWLARLNGLESHLNPSPARRPNAHFWITFNCQKIGQAGQIDSNLICHPCSFLNCVQLLMISWVIKQKTLTKMQKNDKGPLSHWKMKCSFLDYIQL